MSVWEDLKMIVNLLPPQLSFNFFFKKKSVANSNFFFYICKVRTEEKLWDTVSHTCEFALREANNGLGGTTTGLNTKHFCRFMMSQSFSRFEIWCTVILRVLSVILNILYILFSPIYLWSEVKNWDGWIWKSWSAVSRVQFWLFVFFPLWFCYSS